MSEIGLSSIYLQKLATYCLENFVAVIPCDELFSYDMMSKMQFIVNLSHSKIQGTHWVAISIHENFVTYFDSFGKKCSNPWILRKFHHNCLIQSTKQIQAYSSVMCGYFALSFLIEDSKGKSLEEYLNVFHSDLVKNDTKCVSIIKQHIKKNK